MSRAELAEAIEPIYQKFPRKIGKGLGIDRLFQKHFKREDLEPFSRAVQNYADYCDREKQEEKFILHFSTFVGRWRDYSEMTGPTPSTVSISSLEDLSELFKPKTWKETKNEV